MGLRKLIFNRFVRVHIRFGKDSNSYEISWFELQRNEYVCRETIAVEDPIKEKKKIGKLPVIVTYSGEGVIARNISDAPEILAMVTGDEEKFHWTQSPDQLVFVRRDRLDEALKPVGNLRLSVFSVLGFSGEDCFYADEQVVSYIKENLHGNIFFRPGQVASMAMELLCRRLLVPVLVICFVALSVNYYFNSSVNASYSQAVMLYQAFRHSTDRSTAKNDDLSRVVASHRLTLPYDYCWLADRVASVVPRNINLTFLAIQPLTRKPEEGKPILAEQNRMRIKGESSSAGDVYDFIRSLRELKIVKEIKLSEISADNNRYEFDLIIEI